MEPRGRDTGYRRPTHGTTRKRHRIPETNTWYHEEETQDTRDQPIIPRGRDTGYQRPTHCTTRKRHRIPETNPWYQEEETQDT